MIRVQVRVRGSCAGGGFPPTSVAPRHRTRVDRHGVQRRRGGVAEVQGARVAEFLHRLPLDKPPLARITAIETQPCPPVAGEDGFAILGSATGRVVTSVGPDACICADCLAEMCDPADRRWGYPFLNCTQCGPRFTITRRLPYDRPNTAMAGFPLCEDCGREYRDPADRRFHAEPVACPACGPRLSHSIAEVLAALLGGQIVALKGLGGFHLLCDATDAGAVERLRARKERGRKPFAVMVLNTISAERWTRIGPAESTALEFG